MTDSQIYGALFSALETALVGQANLRFGERSRLGEQDYPAVVLAPTRWQELSDVDPEDPERVLWFELAILCRDEGQGGLELFGQADQLTTICAETVRGNSLGGIAIGPRSLIESGQIERRWPIEGHILAGSISYLPDD